MDRVGDPGVGVERVGEGVEVVDAVGRPLDDPKPAVFVELDLRRIQAAARERVERPGGLGRGAREPVHDPVVAEVRQPERAVRGHRHVGVRVGGRRPPVDDFQRVRVEGLHDRPALGKPDQAGRRAVERGRDRARDDPFRELAGRRVEAGVGATRAVDLALSAFDEPDEVAVDLEVDRIGADLLVRPDLPALDHAVLHVGDAVGRGFQEPHRAVRLDLEPDAVDPRRALGREERALGDHGRRLGRCPGGEAEQGGGEDGKTVFHKTGAMITQPRVPEFRVHRNRKLGRPSTDLRGAPRGRLRDFADRDPALSRPRPRDLIASAA